MVMCVIFQWLYEIYFLKPYNEELNSFLTDYNTDLSLLEFDKTTIFDIMIESINNTSDNSNLISNTFSFNSYYYLRPKQIWTKKIYEIFKEMS